MIILTVHIIVCLVIFLLRLFKIIKCEYITIFVALFIPVFGELMLIGKRLSDRHSDRESEKIDVVRPVAEEEKRSIIIENDEDKVIPLSEALVVNDAPTRKEIMMSILYNINRSIVVDEDELVDNAVPLEEAMVINDVATRRNLIMDVLYDDPGDYVTQLNNAKENSDTEVVHYAATALAEIQKDFDIKFQNLMNKKIEDPQNEDADIEYQQLLENYIASGLLEGDALKNQLRTYSKLIGERLKVENTKGKWSLINKKAEADLRLEDVKELDSDIEYMASNWPTRENVYLYRIKSAILKKDRKKIGNIIEQMKEDNIHMSMELRSMAGFWGYDV